MSENNNMSIELNPAEYTMHGNGYRYQWVAEIQGCRIGTVDTSCCPYTDAPRWLIKVPAQPTIWGWNFLGRDQTLVMNIVDAIHHRSREEAEQELALYLLKRSAQ